MFDFLKPAAPIERMPDDKIPSSYKKYRFQVFVSIFIGYAAYYFIRKNFNMAAPYLIETYGYSKAQIGFVGSALGLAYGISKFIMGNVSDRCNPRYFLPLGLILAAIANIMLGFASSVPLLFVLMLLNGWFQGMGWPPCGRTLAHWFSPKERGTWMAIWNVAHNVGAALVPTITLAGYALFATWRGMFYFPALISIAIAIFVLIFLRDTPQSVGLPPIEEYRNDYPEIQIDPKDMERELSGREILFNYVLNNKYIWYIAIANIFIYLVRYGLLDWIPVYLKEAKGFNINEAGVTFALYEWAAIPGTIIVGWLSDKVFHGRRAPMAIICMIGVMAAVFLYWKSENMSAINIAIASAGALIYGPVMLIGVAALDYVPKKAAGTAAGLTGLFGYVGGSVAASFIVGIIADKFSWNGAFLLILASCVLAIIFLIPTWNPTKEKS
ncbi:phosphoglycerate transporter family protein [Acetomicrobium mobile DSM 13181]|uniref:Phosphoglycerate transporter family protein n=1 Tax=Acetomicrobium mobile (strain ATCC BAA-54 / DSM 13181 / JCM 12221 / NGA) TaxID=891968 RepID=I4BWT3_ACEMN|nr:MFS transporter [Acetomicrobium mobile]AFM21740.1 phosphoglycerate transporter family protein [Acetomicrobium mobile DSM 13181]